MRSYAYGLTAAAVALSSSLAVAQQPVEQQDTRQQTRENTLRDKTQGETASHERGDADTQEQLTQYFAGKLYLMNEGTIAMSELAQQRASADEVKQFAQMLVEGHSQLNDKIAQIAPETAAMARLEGARQRHAAGFRGVPEKTEGTPPATGKDRPSFLERLENRLENKADRVENKREHRAEQAERHDVKKTQGAALHQILKIEQQAAQNYLQASTQMLEQYQGQDFDMGFLGFQIGAHTWALAELKAMHSVGNEEFQQLVAEATADEEQHLEKAQELSKKFADQEGTDARQPTK